MTILYFIRFIYFKKYVEIVINLFGYIIRPMNPPEHKDEKAHTEPVKPAK